MIPLDSPPAIVVASSKAESPAGAQTDRGHASGDTQRSHAPVADLRTSHLTLVTQGGTAGAEQYRKARLLADGLLNLRAATLDDIERVRIASENRLRSLRTVYGLTGTPEEAHAASLVSGLFALDHQADLELRRTLRKHPLGGWVKSTLGIGERQGARLLAAVGDPYWNYLYDRPRTVSELWAYCGLHVLHPGNHPPPDDHGMPGAAVDQTDTSGQAIPAAQATSAAGVAPRRVRGQRANWNATAKMRAYLIAEACMKCRQSPYRAVYDTGREKYVDSLHNHPCARCGPAGKPAAVGTPLSAGHQHARALRLVMKAVLKDLWIAARDLHAREDPEPQPQSRRRSANP